MKSVKHVWNALLFIFFRISYQKAKWETHTLTSMLLRIKTRINKTRVLPPPLPCTPIRNPEKKVSTDQNSQEVMRKILTTFRKCLEKYEEEIWENVKRQGVFSSMLENREMTKGERERWTRIEGRPRGGWWTRRTWNVKKGSWRTMDWTGIVFPERNAEGTTTDCEGKTRIWRWRQNKRCG